MHKKLPLLLLSAIMILSGACSDDDSFSWSGGDPVSGTQVSSQPLYTITDYTLPSGNSSVALSSLNEGDRVVLIPLYAVAGSGEARQHTAFRLKAEYSGGPVPETRALHSPLPPSRSLVPLKKRSILRGDSSLPSTRGPSRAPSSPYSVGEVVNFRLSVDYDNRGAGAG